MKSYAILFFTDRNGRRMCRLGDGRAAIELFGEEARAIEALGAALYDEEHERDHTWGHYEDRKREIASKGLAPAEYEEAIRALTQEMGL